MHVLNLQQCVHVAFLHPMIIASGTFATHAGTLEITCFYRMFTLIKNCRTILDFYVVSTVNKIDANIVWCLIYLAISLFAT